MLRIALGLIVTWLACAFPQTGNARTKTHGFVAQYVSVCQIKASPSSYLGKIVRIRGTYKTDTMFYAALISPGCATTPRTINVADPIYTKGDTSVKTFFAHERFGTGCGNQSVCPV